MEYVSWTHVMNVLLRMNCVIWQVNKFSHVCVLLFLSASHPWTNLWRQKDKIMKWDVVCSISFCSKKLLEREDPFHSVMKMMMKWHCLWDGDSKGTERKRGTTAVQWTDSLKMGSKRGASSVTSRKGFMRWGRKRNCSESYREKRRWKGRVKEKEKPKTGKMAARDDQGKEEGSKKKKQILRFLQNKNLFQKNKSICLLLSFFPSKSVTWTSVITLRNRLVLSHPPKPITEQMLLPQKFTFVLENKCVSVSCFQPKGMELRKIE